MLRFNQLFAQKNTSQTFVEDTATASKSFMAHVFSLMVAALGLSGLLAYGFSHTPSLLQYIVDVENGGYTTLGWITMFAPLAFVLTMSFAFKRLSALLLLLFFMAYASVTGVSLSIIFLIYDPAVITTVFFITAGTFGVMALVGYTTQTDLTKLGSILMMALVGMIIAMVVNMFIGSAPLDYLISCIGVLIFTGLVAFDTQKLKQIGAGVTAGTKSASKLATMGALSLYLDFLNLFLFLLRIFGGNRN